MLGADGGKPAGKSGRRKGNAAQSGKKTEPRKRKESQAKGAKPDQLLEALQRASEAMPERADAPIPKQVSEPTPDVVDVPTPEVIDAPTQEVSLAAYEEASEPAPDVVGAAMLEEVSAPVASAVIASAETPLVEIPAIAAVQEAEKTPVSLQTLANAYGEYSRKSLEQTSCFVAKLASAGSLTKAFELQTAFAREAFETFVTESRRIRELHGELAKQRMSRLQRLVDSMTQGAINPTRGS
jgi:phasin family protein